MKEKAHKAVEALNYFLQADLKPVFTDKRPSDKRATGCFWAPNKIYIDFSKKKWIKTLVHEYVHMYSCKSGYKSYQKYNRNVEWRKRAEEQLARRMEKALAPLVVQYIKRGPSKALKKRWRQLSTSIKGEICRLRENQEKRGCVII